MGGFGEGSAEIGKEVNQEVDQDVSKDADSTVGPGENTGKGKPNSGINGHDTNHGSAIGQKETVSPVTWLSETFSGVSKQLIERVRTELRNQALDKLPLLLEAAVVLGPGDKKSFDILLTPETEAKRKLSNALPEIQDFYKKFRQAQMNHEPVGIEAIKDLKQKGDVNGAQEYRDKYVMTMAWLSFPENDNECNEGRNVTDEYIKQVLDREQRNPTSAELTKDNQLLAKIYSLQLNDHDYLNNENEITRRNGMHHLPEKFMGIGLDGQPKEFNLKELAQKQMFAILEGNKALNDRSITPTYKIPLQPDERANLAFYGQVLRQVLPEDLLLADDIHTGQRNAVLAEYVRLYQARNNDCTVGRAKWLNCINRARAEYPDMSSLIPGADLNEAEKIYELLTLSEVRQLRVEGLEMAEVKGNARAPLPGQRRNYELAQPDQERLAEFGKVKAAMREYREGQTLTGRSAMQSVFELETKQYAKLNKQESNRLAGWQANANQWQMVYLGEITGLNYQHNQVEAWQRWPASPWCNNSRNAAQALMDYRDYAAFKGRPALERKEIETTIIQGQTKLMPKGAPAGAPECIHKVMPRRKDKIRG